MKKHRTICSDDKIYALSIYRYVFNSERDDDCDIVGVFDAIRCLNNAERCIIDCQFRYMQSKEQIASTLKKSTEQVKQLQAEIFQKLQQRPNKTSMSISLKSNNATADLSIDKLGLSQRTASKLKQAGYITGGDVLNIIPSIDANILKMDFQARAELFKKLQELGHLTWVVQMQGYQEQLFEGAKKALENFKPPSWASFGSREKKQKICTVDFLCEHFGFIESGIASPELFVRNYLFATITDKKRFYKHIHNEDVEFFNSVPCVLGLEPIEFLCNKLNIQREKIKDENLFMRNYIFITANACKHLIEIKKRVSVLESESKQLTNNEKDYAKERREYFIGKNRKAQKEIKNWIDKEAVAFLLSFSLTKDLINESLSPWQRVYSYYFDDHDMYNPDYDFSTVAKFDNIVLNEEETDPNDILKYFRQRRTLKEKFINLKKADRNLYKLELINYVNYSKIVPEINDFPKCFYHFKNRTEIFNSLENLLENGEYSTFCVLAVIQIEGLFNDYLSILGEKSKGDLGEKVDAAIKDKIQFSKIYSYFKYDFRILRNEVAHSGLLETDDLELTAYELVLDLFCIFNIVAGVFAEKFEPFYKMADITDSDDCNDKEETILKYLWDNRIILNSEFGNVLANPELYDEEMKHFKPTDIPNDVWHLYKIAHDISFCVKSKKFWKLLLDECKDQPSIEKSVKEFMQNLVNKLEATLDLETKELCETVKVFIS